MATQGNCQIRIFNGVPDCKYDITTNLTGFEKIHLNEMDMGFNKFIGIENKILTVHFSVQEEQGCPKFPIGAVQFHEAKAYSIFLQDKIPNNTTLVYEEIMDKSPKANPLVRNLANINVNGRITWRSRKTRAIESDKQAKDREVIELRAATYDVFIGDIKVHDEQLRHGGVYALIFGISNNGTNITRMIEVIEPNSINVLWLIPQYVVMTLGEVMFSVTGLEFSYSEAPLAMKSVLQACWQLTVAFGNVIVIIVAELKVFDSQASEFFLFSGLMFFDMIIFMWVAYRYKPNNPNGVQLQLNNDLATMKTLEQEGQPNPAFVPDYERRVAPEIERISRYTKRDVD